VSRVATAIACCAAAQLLACATAPGADEAYGNAVVQFSYDELRPQTVRIRAKGKVGWVNLVEDSRGFVVFPESMASAFACAGHLEPDFVKTEGGYRSRGITSFESVPVALPCPLAPGVYEYEVWMTEAGLGQVEADPSGQKLRGKIVVE
jgi:hypothetical protein